MPKQFFQSGPQQCAPQLAIKPLALAVSLLFLGAAQSLAHAADGLTELEAASEDDGPRVSGSGDVVVGGGYRGANGNGLPQAFIWTAAGGMQELGTLRADRSGRSAALGVNATGSVVVGLADNDTVGTKRAFRWTAADGLMSSLGVLPGGESGSSWARGVNAAGDVVVGWSDISGGDQHAFRWTLNAGSTTAGTMTDLGTLKSDNTGSSAACGVNANGDVVVGEATTASGDSHAFRWTLNAGSTTAGTMTDLGTLAGGNTRDSVALGVNAAGTVVVGRAEIDNGDRHAFRWTLNAGSTTAGTMSDLGTLRADNAGLSFAYGVNAAGDVVVGGAETDSGVRAFRWTAAGGMQSIESWLAANGVSVSDSAAKTAAATGVSADGRVVVGLLQNAHAFIARVGGGAGLIDQVENARSLTATSASVPSRTLQESSMVMHGAHGSPMRGLPGAGKQNVWLTGDLGRSKHQGNDGLQGAGEFGYARGLSEALTLKLAVGQTYSKQDTAFGGNTRVDGSYFMPEVVARLYGTALHATFSGYYNRGEARMTRGYDNAGVREYTQGEADVETTAVRARLDWLNAVEYGNTAFTPYASVTDTRTTVAAYRESGGAFPANWAGRVEQSTESRLGVDAVHRLDDKLNLLGRLESAHRFEDTGAPSTGDVAGLYSFSLPGQRYKRDWWRAAVGVEGALAQGTLSLMLNGSTQGESTEYWVAASYRVAF
ncbi:autotransporter domain-containing protein [Rhodocyclus tenuis]|uniref:Putative HAF family extracellular repeat protein n=1 Tax=Rhodocyclus tenuis TaxID=1066 RepID=A0A840G836_RHOTE|nr:autotransporter domain-containing protein [Rhodocyclus tenuis]MBB4247100.1 putative HAF family extracellular repeat protein [Rhodocyclus tenuis]